MRLRPIHKVLIANRGEIAIRVARTCARMGIDTVAVFSDADAAAPFVRQCDEAVRIGPPPSRESYLDAARILDAARRTGADAIHPGYGFLSENADFAQAVIDAGLVFIGPPPSAIRAMGDKRRAKVIAREAGVPVIDGDDGSDERADAQEPSALASRARAVGFPVLVKASAGGGGKGMRLVRDDGALEAAIDGARREALASFGDGALLIERYVERPRHVEIQIFADAHGNRVHLWERECSIQRRHQKVIEEAPSPAVDGLLRDRMGEAALKLAAAIGYTGAGTVEMLLDEHGDFYFLEVNTRLQVEHPVTEAIADLDLVELQIRVARGEELPFDQEMLDTVVSGTAIECRLYAEDPARGFLPQSGVIVDWHPPKADWLRIDTGVETGTEIGIEYDPMLAKICVWGADRLEAIDRMRWALARLCVQGVRTNRDFLSALVTHDAFVTGELTTHFIDEHFAGEAMVLAPADDVIADAACFAALAAVLERENDRALPTARGGFRNNHFADQELRVRFGERAIRVQYVDLGMRTGVADRRFRVAVELDGVGRAPEVVTLVSFASPAIVIESGSGVRMAARVVSAGARHHVFVAHRVIALDEEPRFPETRSGSVADGATSPMPGKIVRVLVSEGQEVVTGQTLLVMEAMKMEHSIAAPHDGVVVELHVKEGAQVREGAVLVVVR